MIQKERAMVIMKLNNFRVIIFVLIGGLFLSFTCSYAETIVLKSGKTVEGKLIEKTDKYIKIDFQGVPLSYFLDEVDSIDGLKQNLSLVKEQKVLLENNFTSNASEESITIIADDAHFLRADTNNNGEPLAYKIVPQKEINLDVSNYICKCPKELGCTEPNAIMVTLDKGKTYVGAMGGTNRIYKLNSETIQPQLGSIPFQGFEAGQEGAIILGYINPQSRQAMDFVALCFALVRITE
jgi:hypothetical protein